MGLRLDNQPLIGNFLTYLSNIGADIRSNTNIRADIIRPKPYLSNTNIEYYSNAFQRVEYRIRILGKPADIRIRNSPNENFYDYKQTKQPKTEHPSRRDVDTRLRVRGLPAAARR
jgi:hypothetical protein